MNEELLFGALGQPSAAPMIYANCTAVLASAERPFLRFGVASIIKAATK